MQEMYKKGMVSIIMPCYNTAQYLEETIESVSKQSYKNYELICLDDGSTDNTLELLNSLKQKYNFIKVISNSNKRQGYERNEGVKLAQGEYIYYFDSDDLLKENCLERCVQCMEENQLDVLLFDGETFYDSEELAEKFPQYKTLYIRNEEYPEIYKGEDLYVLQRRKQGEFFVQPCMQMAKTEFIRKNKIAFPEWPMLEDNLYLIDLLLAAERVQCIKDRLYMRRMRDNSTVTTISEEYLQNRIYCFTHLAIETMKYLENYDCKSDVYQTLVEHVAIFNRHLQNCVNDLNGLDWNSQEACDEDINCQQMFPVLQHYDARLQKAIQDNKDKNERLKQANDRVKELNIKLLEENTKRKELNMKLLEENTKQKELNEKLRDVSIRLQEINKEKNELIAKLKKASTESAKLKLALRRANIR